VVLDDIGWSNDLGAIHPNSGFAHILQIDDTVMRNYWLAGNPNRANGDCVQLKRFQVGEKCFTHTVPSDFQGFQLRLASAPCSSASQALLKYTCQYNACDTDKFCPDASFPL
jgi:hypothetical protein